MKIKILKVYSDNAQCDEYNYAGHYYTINDKDSTDWEEVTKEEFDILRQWARSNSDGYFSYAIICESDIKPHPLVKEIIAKAKIEQDRLNKQEAVRKYKTAKRKETLRIKKENKEKALLAELEKKFRSEDNCIRGQDA